MDQDVVTTDADGRLPRILVVDDSRMVRASIVKHIRGRFEAREEPDGEAAWEALLVDPAIEIVLTDIGMPRLDGYGLLERLRASKLPRVRDLPVVIISGDEDESARERALALGANGFVTKGAGGVELLATLMSLLRLSKAQGELERSRAALERQSPVDPESGLATEAYLEHHGAQAVAEARRRQADIGAMVIEVDQFDELCRALWRAGRAAHPAQARQAGERAHPRRGHPVAARPGLLRAAVAGHRPGVHLRLRAAPARQASRSW